MLITPEWLQTLTPTLNQSQPGWTSLASLLTSIGVDNSTGLIDDWTRAASVIEIFTGLLIADAMSRQGFTASVTYAEDVLPWDGSSSSRERLLQGIYDF